MASKEQLEMLREFLRLSFVGLSESIDKLTDRNLEELIKIAKENTKNGN